MKLRLITILAFLFITGHLRAQIVLEQKLEGKNKLQEIMEVVDDHYTDLQRDGVERNPGEPKWKHWQRWAWYQSSRLDADGNFVDITKHTMRAHARMQDQFPNRSTVSNWTFMGPTVSTYANTWGAGNGIGRVDRIAFHPTNPNVIYVGTPAGGLWRTSNGGSTWTPLTDFLPSTGISGIVISHANPNVIYVLTGDGDSNLPGGFVKDWQYIRPSAGVFKSTDGGLTWSPTGPMTALTFYGFRLVQDPNNADILFAATSRGIYRTTDGGDNWSLRITGKFFDVAFKPGDSDRIYASREGEVKYSINGGSTWQTSQLDVPIDPDGRVELATSPDVPNAVYFLAGPRIDSTTFNGIYLSVDNGENFIQMTNTPNILSGSSVGNGDNDQSLYDQGICAAPNNANLIITAGIILWKSTNAGLTMSNITTYWEDPNETWYVHPDVHDVAFNPLDMKLYAATDGGLSVSTDLGENWSDLSNGIEVTQTYHMAGTPQDFNRLFIGNQDNGLKLRTANSSDFQHLSSGDGFDGSFVAGDASQFYITVNTGVSRYWNDGQNAANITPTSQNWYKTVAAHVTDPNMVFVGSDTIFRSPDQGTTWDTLGASGSWAIATCPSNANRIYAAGADWFGASPDGEVYRSDNLGDNWTTISLNTGFPSTFTKVTDIAVHPSNSGTVYATFGGFASGARIVRSTNAGGSWVDFSGSLPEVPVNCAAVDSDGSVYVGTDLGVFYRTPTMADWIPFSNNMPIVPVTELLIYNSEIRASTFGRGVWKSDKASTCSVSSSITGILTGDQYFEASFSLLSTSTVQGGIGTWVSMKAGDHVRLDPGFHVKSGNIFKAYTGSCSSGGIPGN